MKVSAAELAKWENDPRTQISFRMFGALEGAFPSYSESAGGPKIVKSGDGRLWFTGLQFVQMIDPSRDHVNPIPPPVHIENLVADRTNYELSDRLSLPPLTRDFEINYTALSFVVPQNVNFRYRLDGHDTDWQEVGPRRQAFYSDLPPGDYRFHVIASNNDGVWNEKGATLSFSIAPAWYQTVWFRVMLVVATVFVCWLVYRLRVRQISKIISARFDERLAERTRLARELHDTFLQTIQGSKLIADDALEQSDNPVRLRRAIEQLSVWLGQATEEGRAALNSLRATTTEKNNLAEAFQRATESCRLGESATAAFSVVGDSRDLHPIVRDEIYRIGYEAIRNACQHSNASQINVELKYAEDLIVRVKDNGAGIDPLVLAEGKEGHFGLKGMRERAARIGAKLAVTSSAESGTEITLVVPGDLVFRQAADSPLET